MSDATGSAVSEGQGARSLNHAYVELVRARLKDRARRIMHCVDQLDDSQVWWRPTESMNSIANGLLHLGGNIRQWIISGVGGAADVRDRPAEFSEREPIPKAELVRGFLAVIDEADAVLAALDPARLLEPRRIQGSEETVLSAIWKPIEHLAGHAQEVIYITRLQIGDRYQFAWVPSTPEQGAPR